MNYLTPEDIEFKFISSMGFTTYHHAKYLNLEFGIEKETITKKKSDFQFGSSKTYYYITGQEKEYTDLEELCKDWNELKNFDDPDNEIVWVKLVKPKRKNQ